MNRHPISGNEIVTRENFLNTLAETYLLQDAILNATEFSVISFGVDGIINSLNPAAEELLGYRKEELIEKEDITLIHIWSELAAHQKEIENELGISIEAGLESLVVNTRIKRNAERREWTYVRKDQLQFPVMLSVSAIWSEKGELTGYLAIASDITEQRKKDEQIRQSEGHLQALLNSIDDIAFEVARNGTYKNIWTKNEQLLFVDRGEYIGKTIYQVLKGQYAHLLKPFETAFRKVFESRQPEYLEYEIESPHAWRSAKISYIDENTTLVLVRDITQQRLTEQKIIKLSDEYNHVFNYSISLNAIAGFDGYLKRINPVWEKTLGYTLQELQDQPFINFVHPEDLSATIQATTALANGNNISTFENRYRCKDGSYRWLLWTSSSDVQNQCIYASAIDITRRKKNEEHIGEVEDENKYIFQNSITLSIIADLDGKFKKVNPTIQQILGWSERDFIDKTALDFLHPDSIQETKRMMALQAKGMSVLTHENRFRCKDGSYRWLLWSSYADMKRELLYGTAIDITERKKTEEALILSKSNLEAASTELLEQNRQLNEFAHIISHNLRSPVGNISALISLLGEQSTLEDYKEIFERLKHTSFNMKETLNELMETLKIKRGAESERVTLKFKNTLKKIMEDLAGELMQCDGEITFNFSACQEINYNKTYLESILLNLLSNAIKYRSPKRPLKVHFKTEMIDQTVILKVSDNGLGIDMKRYGDKLFGLRKTFHEHKDAKGVGLFLTKSQVEAMGGKIWIESAVDKGTIVLIQF
ncbi:MAG TPA: PAS domain S-box protein [Cyclobacteriaceae bacterium]